MEISASKKRYFTKQLVGWHHTDNDRSLPWKEEKDPYRIWLSEIILQQTRALQGLPYYLRFTEDYPTVNALAKAKDEDAFRLWQGLGYYNRCKNMLATARIIAGEHKGRFPNTYEELLALKGIGPYTASAIASFAYGLPEAVVDGNVYRVLSRYFGIDTPFDTTTASPNIIPDFVPPSESMSIPAEVLISFSAQPSPAAALKKREPSMCRNSPFFFASSAIAFSSSGL